jgi:hypothetical protein
LPEIADPIAAAATAQLSEIGAFEATLHGHDAPTWAAYRELARAGNALASIPDQRLAEIAAVAADESKPGPYRAQETARMSEAAIAEARALHGAAIVAEVRLAGALRAKLVPAPEPIPADRVLAREELRMALDSPDRIGAMTRVLLTARPGVVAELAGDYGKLLLGADIGKLRDATMLATLRQRGGHDEPSRLAAHALAQMEKRNLRGRSDGLAALAIAKLTGR